jgi:CBS domain-containing protein
MDDVRKVSPKSRKLKIVRDVMTPSQKMVVVAPEEKVTEAFHRLQTKDVRQLPVVHGNNIVGLLRRKDIVRWLQFQTHFG